MAQLVFDTSDLTISIIDQESLLVINVPTENVDISAGLGMVHDNLRAQQIAPAFANEYCLRASDLLRQMLAMEVLRTRLRV
jgi:hypothetical protein